MDNKKDIQTKQQIFHHLAEIMELFPQYTTVQHLIHIMRPRTGSYDWDNATFLKKIEHYRDELENELVDTIQDDED